MVDHMLIKLNYMDDNDLWYNLTMVIDGYRGKIILHYPMVMWLKTLYP